MKNLKNKGFTLAETLIVLVILGVVAAITVPALVNRHVEAERRTKLRKAMSVYDTALNKMVIENGIKSDTALTNWADSNTKNDCANTSVYFKVARALEVNGNSTNCKFRAPDGVFWDISDIQKPLIALREQDLNDETAQSDTNRAFYMFGWFDENGSLRSNDMGKISATDKADLQKLYDFIAGKSKTSMGEIASDSTDDSKGEEEPQKKRSYDEIMNDESLSYKEKFKEFSENEDFAVTLSENCADLTSNSLMTDIALIFDQKAYAKPSSPSPCIVILNRGNTFLGRWECSLNYEGCTSHGNSI